MQPQPLELPNQLFPLIWHYLKNRKRYLAGFILVALVWAGEMSLSPYLLKVIIDAVIKYTDNQTALLSAIMLPGVLYISMSLVMNLNFRLDDYLNLRLYPDVKAEVSRDMFAYLINHSYSFFQNHFAGSLARKINDMGSNIDQIISIVNIWFYPRIFAMVIASVTLFVTVGPIFGLILLVWAIAFILLSFVAAKKTEGLARINSETAAKMSGTLADSLTNIMSTKLFANFGSEIANLDKDIEQLVITDRRVRWTNMYYNFIQGLSVTVLVAAMLGALIYGNVHHWVTPGDFALVLMLTISFLSMLYEIGQQMLKFSKTVAICNQALSFMQVPHEITDAKDAKPLQVTQGEIVFSNVTFQYANNNVLFDKLNVTIMPGQKVGLVGYSGGGKSSFIKLILRLMDTQQGEILIDGQNIKQVTNVSLRKQIGTIPQEPDLFHRTIMENIRFARLEASDAEVIEAAKKAKCHEFICELPHQYQSLVGERGIKLSGGQKQRIAIARAFLKQAPILLLDEATSSLDSITERDIHEGLHAVMEGRTTVVIAHRLSTLKDMDRILVFVSGQILEDGDMDQLLLDTNSHFYKLWQMQADGFIPAM